MTRLTIHLEEPIFFERAQKNIGSKENPILKPKKSKCIQNTLTFKNISEADAKMIIADVRKKHGIRKWKQGANKGLDMIYIVK